jgi:DNA-binding LacI/PurR family transcriptional regulator
VGVTVDNEKVRAPSIRDVARIADVSHQTVSRVLNDHPSIRPVTRQRVLDAMAELHFRPNRAARMLVTSRSRTIGVLAAASGWYYGPASSIAAIENAARDAGYSVTITNVTSIDAASVERALDHLVAEAVEGLVIMAPQMAVVDAIAQLDVDLPSVTLQAGSQEDQTALAVDQVGGARLAVAHLLELGHRRIAHIAGPQDWLEAQARLGGYEAELAAHGLAARPSPAGDWTAESGYRLGLEVLRDPTVTAVFAGNDQMALGLIHAAQQEGRRVPDDLSVVGFDDIPEAAHFLPPLTTVRQDFAELGRRAIEVLVQRLRGDATAAQPIAPELVLRASTAVAR